MLNTVDKFYWRCQVVKMWLTRCWISLSSDNPDRHWKVTILISAFLQQSPKSRPKIDCISDAWSFATAGVLVLSSRLNFKHKLGEGSSPEGFSQPAADTACGLQEITRKPSCRWQTRATQSMPKIAPIRRAYNVVADNTGLSSIV